MDGMQRTSVERPQVTAILPGLVRFRNRPYWEVIEQALSEGRDGVVFRNTFDPVPNTTNYIVFDPANIRSRFAAFRDGNSRNILAGLGGGVAIMAQGDER